MLELHIPSMICGRCAGLVARAIQDAAPGAKISVDLARRTVLVVASAPPDEVCDALLEAGYPAAQRT